jgi:hypothetical protein
MLQGWRSQACLGHETAVVIPVYFSARAAEETIERLLRITLMDLHHCLPPEQVWAVVDGDLRSAAILRRVAQALAPDGAQGIQILVLPENRGKLGAMAEAMRAILREQPHVRWLAVMDNDADHLATVLPQLVRAAGFLADVYGHDRVLAIGARASRTRPMGWVRGELELLLDQLTLDALHYALAQRGAVLDLSQCLSGATPDLNSGFKVYGRRLAELLFDRAEPVYATLSPADYDRYGPETVTVVETALAGGVMGEVLRPTWDGQLTTSFGEYAVVEMYGELLAWVWARLGVASSAAAQMFDNRRRGLALGTAAEGAELVGRLRAHALGRLATHCGEPAPHALPLLPFV